MQPVDLVERLCSVQQVFLNLLLNAIHASPQRETIRLLIEHADDPSELRVKVIDRGVGIPKKILERIFEPFFTTKERDKGTGLGLSVSQGIIAKHNGRTEVVSEEGLGTSFSVILPIGEETT